MIPVRCIRQLNFQIRLLLRLLTKIFDYACAEPPEVYFRHKIWITNVLNHPEFFYKGAGILAIWSVISEPWNSLWPRIATQSHSRSSVLVPYKSTFATSYSNSILITNSILFLLNFWFFFDLRSSSSSSTHPYFTWNFRMILLEQIGT